MGTPTYKGVTALVSNGFNAGSTDFIGNGGGEGDITREGQSELVSRGPGGGAGITRRPVRY